MSRGAPVFHPFPVYPRLRRTCTFLKLQFLISRPVLDSCTAFHGWLRSPPTPLKCVWDSELCYLIRITHFIFIVFPSAIWVPRVQSKWDVNTCVVQLDLILGSCCGREDGKILRVRRTLSPKNVRVATSMRPHRKGFLNKIWARTTSTDVLRKRERSGGLNPRQRRTDS